MAQLDNVSDIYKDTLDVLMITVLVDERVRDEERIELLHNAAVLNRALHPDIILPPEILNQWFTQRMHGLSVEIAADGMTAVKENYLSKINDKGLQRTVLASVYAIATCDYELHDEERGLIKTALEVWQSHLPDPTEVDAVA